MKKIALITGISGQDGSYLAEFLLSKDYEVHGIVRRTSLPILDRIAHILPRINIHQGDLVDLASLIRIVDAVKPDEFYNLAAQSFVHISWNQSTATANMTALGVTNVLDAIRIVDKDIKFYQASSSEMFGKVQETPQSENTPFYPRSPYGISKLYGHWMTVNFRESYDMFCCSGILYNHESPRRGYEFVTRKITSAVAKIKCGKQKELFLGNLDAVRDWGYAGDFVEAMWLMLQQEKPEDYVIATGKTTTVREFAKMAFECLDLDYLDYVKMDHDLYRPAEVDLLLGDPTKAEKYLGWKHKVDVRDLVNMMVRSDYLKEKQS
jgi:GDPmannose 4,6-dehydratase